jgi:hypothetical protein
MGRLAGRNARTCKLIAAQLQKAVIFAQLGSLMPAPLAESGSEHGGTIS